MQAQSHPRRGPLSQLLRAVLSLATASLVFGLAGGLMLGFLLSRRGNWFDVGPWTAYALALLVLVGAASWLDERRRLRGTGLNKTDEGERLRQAEITAADPSVATEAANAGTRREMACTVTQQSGDGIALEPSGPALSGTAEQGGMMGVEAE